MDGFPCYFSVMELPRIARLHMCLHVAQRIVIALVLPLPAAALLGGLAYRVVSYF
jgi:hypothetical protein